MAHQDSGFAKGYQAALDDIAQALEQNGEEGVREWLEANRQNGSAS